MLSGVGGTWGWRSRSLLPLPRSCPRLCGRQAEKCPARSGRNRRRGVGTGRGEKLQGAKRGRPRPSPGPASVHAEVPRTLSRCALQTRGLRGSFRLSNKYFRLPFFPMQAGTTTFPLKLTVPCDLLSLRNGSRSNFWAKKKKKKLRASIILASRYCGNHSWGSEGLQQAESPAHMG